MYAKQSEENICRVKKAHVACTALPHVAHSVRQKANAILWSSCGLGIIIQPPSDHQILKNWIVMAFRQHWKSLTFQGL
jgi:hypothetical protein